MTTIDEQQEIINHARANGDLVSAITAHWAELPSAKFAADWLESEPLWDDSKSVPSEWVEWIKPSGSDVPELWVETPLLTDDQSNAVAKWLTQNYPTAQIEWDVYRLCGNGEYKMVW